MEEAQELEAQIWMQVLVEAWDHRCYLPAHFFPQLQQLWCVTPDSRPIQNLISYTLKGL